jgi:hypothetical protein
MYYKYRTNDTGGNTVRKAKKLAVIALIILTIVGMVSVQKENERLNAYSCDPNPVTVQAGDTLYWLVSKNCVGNTQRALDDIVDLRGSTNINPGERITLVAKP